MKINLLVGSITYGTVTIFSRIASIILIPILTRLLSPEEYGTLSILLTVIQLANFVVTLEVAQAVTLFFTDRNRQDRDFYPSTALWFSLGMYVVFLLLVSVIGEMTSTNIAGSHLGKIILTSGVILLAANGVFFLIQNQLRLEFKSRQYALLTIGYTILISIGAIVGASYHSRSTEGVIWGQAAGAAVIDIIGIILLWKRFRLGFNTARLKKMLQFSLPLVPAGLLLIGSQQVPKLILSVYGNLEDVGIYGLAFQIAGFAGLAVLGVQTAITPAILANHHEAETPKMLGKLFESFTVVSLIFCSFLSVFANELVMIFSVPSYARAANFVPFLSFAIALNSLYIFFPGKIIKGKSAAQLIASAGSFLVAVTAGIILTKIDGVRGVAISTLLSAASFFFIWYYISQKLYRLPINWLKLLYGVVVTIIVCSTGIFLIPPGLSFYTIVIKGCVLLLFTYLIAKDHLQEWKKKYLNKYLVRHKQL